MKPAAYVLLICLLAASVGSPDSARATEPDSPDGKAPVDSGDESVPGGDVDLSRDAGDAPPSPDIGGQPLESRLERELGQAGIPEDAHPLLAIARQMRDVQARLAQQAADTETTAMQEQIVAQLDALLQHARSQQMASAESARQAPPSPDRRPGPQPDDQAAAEGDPQQAPAREATDDPGTAESVDERPDPQRTLHAMERLWNQLPERQREQLLQLAPEQFLPKYETQIEQYFRRLSQD